MVWLEYFLNTLSAEADYLRGRQGDCLGPGWLGDLEMTKYRNIFWQKKGVPYLLLPSPSLVIFLILASFCGITLYIIPLPVVKVFQ